MTFIQLPLQQSSSRHHSCLLLTGLYTHTHTHTDPRFKGEATHPIWSVALVRHTSSSMCSRNCRVGNARGRGPTGTSEWLWLLGNSHSPSLHQLYEELQYCLAVQWGSVQKTWLSLQPGREWVSERGREREREREGDRESVCVGEMWST